MIGNVYLVGAGPGDPDLLTIKAATLLASADAIVCDRLVGDGVLKLGNPNAEWHYVGKTCGCGRQQQDSINHLLLKLANEGKTVVRLKGGDPFIFGRGGEEMSFLAERGVRVDVVPGITAAAGCAASLGVPLTHRGMASSVRFVAGHMRDDVDLDLDWRSLVDDTCTLVFYMAMSNVNLIAASLANHGMSKDTPVMLVHSGTTPKQDAATTTLSELPQIAQRFRSPALLIIGKVVALKAMDESNPAGVNLHDAAQKVTRACATAASF